jgi:hypothetical protein
VDDFLFCRLFPSVISVLSVVEFVFISTSAISRQKPARVGNAELFTFGRARACGNSSWMRSAAWSLRIFTETLDNVTKGHTFRAMKFNNRQSQSGQPPELLVARRECEKRKSNPLFIVSSQSRAGHRGIR